MLQFSVSLGGKDTMVGGSGEPARPRNHGGGMLATHHYTLLHIITRKSFLLHTLCNKPQKIMIITHHYTLLHSQSPMGSCRPYYTVYYTLLHVITHLLHGHDV